jgi:hypothetical protein
MKILVLYLSRLRNEAHYQFFAALIALIHANPIIKEKVLAWFEKLVEIFNREDEVVDFIRKSDYTTKIVEADNRLNKAVVGFSETILGATHHFNPGVADAALSLKNLLKTFGKIIHKNYDEELAAITNLLQELDGAYMEKVELISGLSEWVEEIRGAGNNLNALLVLRNAEKAAKPQERMNDIRKEIDPAYRELVKRIEAFSLVEGELEYASFINELNALIERFNHIRPHKTAKKNTEE